MTLMSLAQYRELAAAPDATEAMPTSSPHASPEPTSDVAEDVPLDRCRVCSDLIAVGERLARNDRGIVVACHLTCAGMAAEAAQALRRKATPTSAATSEAVPGLRMTVRYHAEQAATPATATRQQPAAAKRTASVDDFADAYLAQSGGAASELVDAAADAYAGHEPHGTA